MAEENADFSASGVASVAGVSGASYACVTGLPGVAYVQGGTYYDINWNEVEAPTDVEFVELKSSRTGASRLVSLTDLATLLA